MNLRQIEVFRAVFAAQSISGGARQLNVAQPSVSRLIHHLQRQLGYELFVLRGGRIVPTPQAIALFRETNGLFERVQRVAEVAAGLRTGLGERLAVLSYYSAGLQAVPQAMCEVARCFPDGTLSLDIKAPAEQIDDVLRGDADVGVAGNVPALPTLEQRLLGIDRLVAILPKGHLEAARDVLDLQTVARLPCIAAAPTSPVGRMLHDAFAARGLSLRTHVSVGSPTPVFELVRQLNGVGLLGAMVVGAAGQLPGFVIRPLDVEISYPVSVFWHAHAPYSPMRTLLVDLLTRKFRTTGRGAMRS